MPPYYRDDKTIKNFGKKLREIRLSKNVSQEQLALACGLEYSQINRIELGKVNTSISHVALLAKHLGVTPCDLFNFL
ncbi:helix-turn-helix domain-containing protein [Paraflavisolibacter caeni]|uniref:helix-turn-helix domain-containing protein n=1 Tax=Paraflavisolibacter caeni TaxID=2982496 RepID=UPI003C6DE498